MSLPLRIALHRDEYLPGAIVRAGAAMSYDLCRDVLLPIGIKGKPESVASLPKRHASALAAHLNHCGNIEPLFMPRLSSSTHDFFGAEIRTLHREVQVRRLAPGTLKDIGYHKAAWQLRALSFDPRTKERLISECPVCGTSLGFVWSRGLAFCDRCQQPDENDFMRPSVDLRDFPQDRVEIEDMEALDFFTSIIDPDPEVRDRFSPALHDDLSAPRGALYELAFTIACAIRQRPERAVTSVAKPGGRDDFDRLEPSDLARGGRVLMNWPEGFHVLCDEVRSNAEERPGHYGVKKELGALYAVTTDRALPIGLRAAVRKQIEQNMAVTAYELPTVRKGHYRNRADLLTMQAASDEYGIRRKLMSRLAAHPDMTVIRSSNGSQSAPVLFLRSEIEAVAAARGDMEAAGSAAVRMGVPTGVMQKLAAVGLVDRVEGPVLLLMVGKEYYARSSVDRLIAELQAKVVDAVPPETYIRLTKALYRLPPGEKPWAELIRAVLDDRVQVFRIEGRLTAAITSLAAASFEDVRRAVAVPGAVAAPASDLLTHAEAAVMLGVTEVTISRLIGKKLLAIHRQGQVSVRREDVLAIAGQWMFTNEIGRRIGVPNRLVRKTLAALGREPDHMLYKDQSLVFDRNAVEALLPSVESIPGQADRARKVERDHA